MRKARPKHNQATKRPAGRRIRAKATMANDDADVDTGHRVTIRE